MITLPDGFRQAEPKDALAMAELVNMAGEGMPVYLWSGMATTGQSAWDVGRERAKRESGGFSFRNTIVKELDGRAIASLVSYGLNAAPEPTDYSEMPPMFVPLQELEDLVPGTWYVNVLATYPEYRGRGYGAALLALAESQAQAAGKRGMSLVVADSNVGARALYERIGYEEKATRAMVKEAWEHPGQNWVLLVKWF